MKINQDLATTVVGTVSLIFATLGALDFIPLPNALFACGVCTQIISYFVKKEASIP
jgi:hypothetical protein